MTSRFVGGLVVPLVLLCCAVAADDDDLVKKLKNADAKKAVLTYEQAVAKAQEAFEKDVATARKKLSAELEAAQAKATKANELEESIAIRDVRTSLTDGLEKVQPTGRVQIVAAFYGQNISWLDVT